MKKNKGHLIAAVEPGSAAEELELRAGDRLLSVNGRPVQDVFDYRTAVSSECATLLVLKPDGEEWELEIENGGEDPGLVFENGLMSEYRSCTNNCIFCFIDQMPGGMRDTLYFKDDDSRLSFLQGNYITLTNMKDADIQRIIRYRLEPINISVHTTNPELRVKMLRNRFAGEKLKYLKTLYDAGIEMNGQIVLCKDWNDGKELEKTLMDLLAYAPLMQSVSVVPVGLTDYRENLCPLQPVAREDFGQTLRVWGVPQGPFLVLPFLGPSTVRVTVGRGGDWATAVQTWVDPDWAQWTVWGVDALDARARLLDLEGVLDTAVDPYAQARDGDLQFRKNQVYDGAPPEDSFAEDPGEDPAPGTGAVSSGTK